MRTNFLRVSGIVAMILILAAVGLANSSVQASQAAQATGTPAVTVSATTARSTGGGGATIGGAATAAGTAIPTALATIGGEEAFPPCPQVVIPTLPATVSAATIQASATTSGATASATTAGTATMQATTSATPAATVAATANSTSVSQAATAAGTTATANATTEPTMAVGAFQQGNGCVLIANMTGDQEVPKPGPSDAKGTATITITRPGTGPGTVCFQLQVSGIKLPATAAHIHQGPAGIAGPVVVPLSAPDAQGKSEGCTSNVNRSLIKAILTFPTNYYANVHSTEFPAGAMRGQLMPQSNKP